MTVRPFQFAVVATGASSQREWVELARRAEDLGYDSILVTDHVHQELAPLPALAVAAAVTTRIGLGTYALGNDFRNPVVLAKEIASLALLSERHVRLGVGAGWLLDDYRRTGVPFERGGRRVDRLTEAVTILDALLREGKCAFRGEHYEVDVDELGPVPPVRPSLLVGGGGRRVLSLAARTAEVVSLLPRATPTGSLDQSDATPARVDEKVAVVRAAAGGRDIVLNHVLWECLVTPRPEPILDVFARSLACSPDEVRQIPSMLIGTAASVAETLRERRDRWGLSLVTVPADALGTFAPVVAELSGR